MRTTTALIALMGLATVAQAQEIRPQPGTQFMPLRIFDATGKFMGGTVPESGSPGSPGGSLAITFRYHSPIGTTKGDTFTLRIRADASGPHLRYRWAPGAGDSFLFESTDCTGQPYADAETVLPGRRVALVDLESNLLYMSEPDPLIVTRTSHSHRYSAAQCIENTGPNNFQAVEIDPVIDLGTVFTPPFELR